MGHEPVGAPRLPRAAGRAFYGAVEAAAAAMYLRHLHVSPSLVAAPPAGREAVQ